MEQLLYRMRLKRQRHFKWDGRLQKIKVCKTMKKVDKINRELFFTKPHITRTREDSMKLVGY